MKYIHTSMAGTYEIDCEFVRCTDTNTALIKFFDLFSNEVIEREVDFDDIKFEMKDRCDHTVEITTAEECVVFKEPVFIGYVPRKKEEYEFFDFENNIQKVGERWFIFYGYDFGMECKYTFKEGKNWLGIDSSMSDKDIVKRVVEFDLAHAFDHPQEDPNYTHTHWALYGNLKDRVKEIIEPIE